MGRHSKRAGNGDGFWSAQQELSAEEWSARRCARLLATMERAWRAGLLLAVADAVSICRSHHVPPPPWLVEASAKVAALGITKAQWRRRRENMIHFTRWDAVKEEIV